jgi:branched-chain amino acid transport system permease protein
VLQQLLQGALSGFLIGSVYGLIALGLNVIFGTIRVINFAQGSLLMVAMFVSYWLWALFGLHPYWSPLVSVPALFALGYALQAWLVAPLLARERAREPMSALLLTLGVALVLDNLALLFFQADFKTVMVPIGTARLRWEGLIISVPRLVGLATMVATASALWVFFTRTDLGRAIRAVGQDRQVARLLGIDDRRIYNVAFALGTALMGIAGAVLAPFYYTHPAVGTTFILKAFVIVVLGGLGSMPGAALGGVIVGVVEGVIGLYTQAAVAQVALLGLFVLLLFVRPMGLLGVERR